MLAYLHKQDAIKIHGDTKVIGQSNDERKIETKRLVIKILDKIERSGAQTTGSLQQHLKEYNIDRIRKVVSMLKKEGHLADRRKSHWIFLELQEKAYEILGDIEGYMNDNT